jgi:hypothetical protein
MSNRRKSRGDRGSHDVSRRNEWFGLIYVRSEVVQLLAPEGESDRETVLGIVNQALRPVYDSHYEAGWPNVGRVPYTSVYRTKVDGQGPFIDIEIRTWPGERTEVFLGSDSPRERAGKLGRDQVVNPPSGTS